MEAFLFQATVYLAAAVISVPIATRLGLGSVLGCLAAGIIVGPVFGLVGDETQDIQHFAEFGVVMMLFIIGLELEPQTLWSMRHKLLGLGGAQVVLTMALVTGAAIFLGLDSFEAIAIGMILALSSTAIVLQTLQEKRLMRTPGGNASFSVLLTQDIAVIPMLALMPLLATRNASHGGGDHSGEAETTAEVNAEQVASLIDGLPGWGVTLVTLAAITGIIVAGIYGTRPAYRFIHRAHMRELYVSFALLIVISIAFTMSLLGLSPALGTFLAGVVLANSEFRHQLRADIEPFKGLLLGLFFITVGAGISFPLFFEQPFTILGLTFGLMMLKGIVLFTLGKLSGLGRRDRWLFTLGLAQAGEFGFVLTSFSLQTGVLGRSHSDTILLVIAMSMLLTPLFFILWEMIRKRIAERDEDRPQEADEIDHKGKIIIAGIGRFGQIVNRMLHVSGLEPVVLDHNLDTILLMRKFGFRGFFGDPTRPELLHAAGLDEAQILVVAMDEKDDVTNLVAYARKAHPELQIIARAYDRNHVYELHRAGADEVVREVFDSSLRAARYVLERTGISDLQAREMERTFFRLDRSSLRELADLWDPGVPISQNEAYLERARALNAELETELSARAEHARSSPYEEDDSEEDDSGDLEKQAS
ncbi:monovalent cation:proton antiporter-2 (CPA2) family protein [Palleronia caenipelagi]|uniref:Potassium transporter n=1 Tax=Palleronia caenipelagi TaxID=2489174 RepID=A0A547Q357_9RHOB|nr:monovalent cation:proton antiporter-2 (CPA2) family protein [Palleronia caenipelagi]TRD20815.1 potassium transporter [Palleronia caenipelagi]